MKLLKNIRYLFLTVFLSLAISQAFAHPVHVSLLNIELSEDGKWQLVVKLFMDDFENILNQKYACEIKINPNTNFDKLKTYGTLYVKEHMGFKVNNNPLELDYQFKKFKTNHEAVWLYFEVDTGIKITKGLEIENSLMCDQFDDQTNLLILDFKGKQYAHKFDCSKQNYVLDVNS